MNTPVFNKIRYFLCFLLVCLANSVVQANNISIIKTNYNDLEKVLENPSKYDRIKIKGIVLQRKNYGNYLIQNGNMVVEIDIPPAMEPEKGFNQHDIINFEGKLVVNCDHSVDILVKRMTYSF